MRLFSFPFNTWKSSFTTRAGQLLVILSSEFHSFFWLSRHQRLKSSSLRLFWKTLAVAGIEPTRTLKLCLPLDHHHHMSDGYFKVSSFNVRMEAIDERDSNPHLFLFRSGFKTVEPNGERPNGWKRRTRTRVTPTLTSTAATASTETTSTLTSRTTTCSGKRQNTTTMIRTTSTLKGEPQIF